MTLCFIPQVIDINKLGKNSRTSTWNNLESDKLWMHKKNLQVLVNSKRITRKNKSKKKKELKALLV